MSTTEAGRSPAHPLDHDRVAAVFTAARAGDQEAFDELIGLLTPLLWHVARAQGIDRERSGDVVQTVWLRLLGSLEEIHSPVALTSWLVTVTKRQAWRAQAQYRAEQPVDEKWFPALADPAPGPEHHVLTDDRRAALWEAVGRLPERCRRLLRIVAFVPRPDYDQVSAALGMKKGSIGPTRGRCLSRLRSLLADGEWP
ncbi:RNA polymerase sigma factor [Amycolatopsis vancoresmycina]|uniref:RNA polymerase sigma-70 factor, ECF subfamily protein n=1 Tax=Amycolatopsis vancoresmycina DSM 44592 TaxID=1292037 RepID=R1HZ46_9PSEU|nr:sigma-70 family RNA polymerase sigma factor [Amycolatopsis vancoresmycina]EOD65571.1 RNA polymerase sigma-70 factor, ECF subfamily protein [Amycolatopsis vancoresmycina DSM 44592]